MKDTITIIISGSQGIGKSRLANMLLPFLQGMGFDVLFREDETTGFIKPKTAGTKAPLHGTDGSRMSNSSLTLVTTNRKVLP